MKYSVLITPLTDDNGGGYASLVPDLPGCMSDGETPAEALAKAIDFCNSQVKED